MLLHLKFVYIHFNFLYTYSTCADAGRVFDYRGPVAMLQQHATGLFRLRWDLFRRNLWRGNLSEEKSRMLTKHSHGPSIRNNTNNTCTIPRNPEIILHQWKHIYTPLYIHFINTVQTNLIIRNIVYYLLFLFA